MKKTFTFLLGLCLMLAIANVSFAQVSNGDFESWSGNTPSDWTTIDGSINVSRNTSIVKEGSSSAAISVNTTTQSSTDFRQTITVTPNTNYTFSAWVYHTEGNVKARLYVNGYQNYSNNNLTNQWQQISFNYTPTSSSIEVGLRFYDQSGFDGSEIVYIDDFQPNSNQSGGGGNPVNCSDTEVTFDLTTDNYGSETSWELKNSTGTVLYQGDSYASNSNYSETFCLADGNYSFTIYDSYGDGICCSHGNGAYNIKNGNTTLASGGSFSSSETKSFSIGNSSGGGDNPSTPDLSGYYQNANGLSGYALKTALHGIIKNGHSNQGYGSLWTFYSSHEKDFYYENDGSILDIYSENPNGSDPYNFTPSSDQCGGYSGEGSCYNREHSFPKSWFGGTVEPMNSDVHHIFPSDGYVNGIRSSYPYGEVSSSTFTSNNGSKRGTGQSGYSGTVFEPIDEFKGDLARAYFYMATRYEDVIDNWENNSFYGNAVLDGSDNKVFETWALNLLIDWHNSDPVSQKEIDRNNNAYNYQGNRNPFVDYPEFVSLIWGSGNSRKSNVSIEEQTFSFIYSQETLQIKLGSSKVADIQIYDLTGRMIFQKTVSENTSIPLQLNKGELYIFRSYTTNGVDIQKLIF
ncbi:endonuclease [Sediminitomix flava]|uniref:Putative secreted protein (Por secretion system target) n=1 Tax=Sediminitomix flava TaxID=379075 RepID=A0A315ZGS3_SEDFL|nr:endonuclease [Sediminitomix flava]PWJ44786.1 putative secreted protein (Por secretion system target) [Sediminitomix flava]